MNVWDSVMVIDTADARNGEAGVVEKIDRPNDQISVKFDLDNAVIAYKQAQLRLL